MFKLSQIQEIIKEPTVEVTCEKLLVKKFKDFNITIYGTSEEPLFKAKDIGDLLEIKEIDSTIRDFDKNQHVIHTMHNTYGTIQEISMLTQYGLYEVIFTSSKEIAKEFKKWVCEVIKEIRSHAQLEIKEALKIKEEELIKYKSRTYEEIDKTACVYIMSTDKNGIYKCGKTKYSAEKRKAKLQTGCVDTIKVLFEYKTSNDTLLESILHYIFDRYRTNSNREHFECDLEYMKMIIEYMGKMIDTCKSSFQTISREEFVEKVNNNLSLPLYKRGLLVEDEYDFNSDFINRFIIKKEGSYITWCELWRRFKNCQYNEHNIIENKKEVKMYFEAKVFRCKAKQIKRNGNNLWGWRGFELKNKVINEQEI